MADTLITSSSSSRSKTVLHTLLVGVLFLALLGGHGWWLKAHTAEAAAGANAPGHAIPAKQLAQEGHAWITPESPVQYIGDLFMETPDGSRYASQLAPGLAWITAPVYMFGGYRAAMYVNPILASLTVLFLFLLCHRWMGGWFALLAALAYAVNPTANHQVVHADAHTGGTAFLVIGLYFLDGWARKPGSWKALLAGLAFGMAPTLRPVEVVCGIGVALVILTKVWQEGPRWRELFLLFFGAAVPLGVWVIHNHMAFGTWLPEDPTSTATELGWTGMQANAISYVKNIGDSGAGMFLGLGLAGVVAMVCQRDTRLLGIALLGILVPVAALPMLQDPTFPLLTLGAFWVLRQLTLSAPRVGWPAALAVTALTIATGLPVAAERMATENRGNQIATTVVAAADQTLAKGSLVVCGSTLADPLEFAGWRIVDEDLITGTGEVRAMEAAARRSDDTKPQQRHYRAGYLELSGTELTTQILEDVFRWADGRKVYWVGRGDDYESFRVAAEAKGQLAKVCEIEMPAPDGQPVLVYEWLPEKTGTDSRKDK